MKLQGTQNEPCQLKFWSAPGEISTIQTVILTGCPPGLQVVASDDGFDTCTEGTCLLL